MKPKFIEKYHNCSNIPNGCVVFFLWKKFLWILAQVLLKKNISTLETSVILVTVQTVFYKDNGSLYTLEAMQRFESKKQKEYKQILMPVSSAM